MKLGHLCFCWVRFSLSDPVLSRSSRSHHLESSTVQDLEPATPAPSSSIIVSCWGVGATSEAGQQGRQAAAPTASWGGMGEHWSGGPAQGGGAQGAKLMWTSGARGLAFRGAPPPSRHLCGKGVLQAASGAGRPQSSPSFTKAVGGPFMTEPHSGSRVAGQTSMEVA